MANEDPKRYEWLLSFPMDDIQNNSSDITQNNATKVDSAQSSQDASNSSEFGEGAMSSSAGLGEGESGAPSGGVQTGCDGGCAM